MVRRGYPTGRAAPCITNDQPAAYLHFEDGDPFRKKLMMNASHSEDNDDSGDNNVPSPEFAGIPGASDRILNSSGWLCGIRVDNIDGPESLTRRVALHINGTSPLIEETKNIFTEVITTHNQRESGYVHHGWSVGAATTVSPWTASRIHATNRNSRDGAWVTRRTLAQRIRVKVLLEDLAPIPEFEAAIEEALGRPTRFEKFQAVYRALDHWGDVVPLEIEMGTSLSLTDTEANFSQLPLIHTALYNCLGQLSSIKTANILKKGGASNVGWDDGSWTTIDVPATEWRPIRINAVAPTLSLLSDDIQTRLANLHDELLTYAPTRMLDLIHSNCKMHDDTRNASKTISQVGVRYGHHIVALSVTYRDGTTSGEGGTAGSNDHKFMLAEGEHIVEMITFTNGEWLRAIQFITNKGRCSGIYGWVEGTPTISRSEGGVLSGFLMRTKQHPQHGYLVTEVNGIWRHDVIPRAPKESDVYSDYIRGKNEHGKGFNDRALIGNSNSAYISSVEIRAHGDIHSIELTYTDTRNGKIHKFKSPRHGGSHGPYYRFDLERGEHIVSVTGKYSDSWLTQLCFATNLGRTSDVYGGGQGQAFSARAPLGEDGSSLRLQYVLGKCEAGLNGVMFVWTPGLPS
ncbi:hypothetical protein OPQ81_010547 [Rhizoctonia solani]|nr:hypothetical protein OPQ81_010547 [Rhizoctonia solani]